MKPKNSSTTQNRRSASKAHHVSAMAPEAVLRHQILGSMVNSHHSLAENLRENAAGQQSAEAGRHLQHTTKPRKALPVQPTNSGCTPGFVDIDIFRLPGKLDDTSSPYIYVAIDQATRWVFLEVYADDNATCGFDFLRRLLGHSPIKIRHVRTDSGATFTDCLSAGDPAIASSNTTFTKFCNVMDITHHRISPGQDRVRIYVERLVKSINTQLRDMHFLSRKEVGTALAMYMAHYNHHAAQPAIG